MKPPDLHTHFAERQFYEWRRLLARKNEQIRELRAALRAERENHALAQVIYGDVK